MPGITFSEHVLPLVSAAAIPWAAKQLWENVFVSSTFVGVCFDVFMHHEANGFKYAVICNRSHKSVRDAMELVPLCAQNAWQEAR